MPPASASTPAAKIRARLLELLGPVVTAAGYDLEDVTVTSAGRRSLVRVVVDADAGVDLDAVATLSRAMSEVLDADSAASAGSAFFADPYVLEVSSPGVDRPLTEQRHWRRAVGRLVEVTVDGAVLTGRVLATDARGIELEVAGVKGRAGRTHHIAWSSLGRGKVQVEFNRKGAADDLDDDDLDDADLDDTDLDDTDLDDTDLDDEED